MQEIPNTLLRGLMIIVQDIWTNIDKYKECKELLIPHVLKIENNFIIFRLSVPDLNGPITVCS